MPGTHNNGKMSCQEFANCGAVLSVLAFGGSALISRCLIDSNPAVSYVFFGTAAVAMVAAPTVIERVTGREL